MTDDLESRAEEFEKKIEDAGGSEGIIGGLVKQADRNRRTVLFLQVALVIVAALALVLGLLTYISYQNDSRVDRQSAKACHQSITNTVLINALLNTLIVNVENSKVYSSEEAKMRIKSYQALMTKIPSCPEDPNGS